MHFYSRYFICGHSSQNSYSVRMPFTVTDYIIKFLCYKKLCDKGAVTHITYTFLKRRSLTYQKMVVFLF